MSDELGKSLQHSVNQKFGSGTYQVLQPIKRGSDGYVYKIQYIKQKRLAALKVLPRHKLSIESDSHSNQARKKYKPDNSLQQKAQNQIKIHQQLRSNYIVKLYNSSKDDMNYYIFLQYISKGDLGDQIEKYRQGLNIGRVRKIGLQLAKGIDTLHKKYIVHRDIKPQNILLNEDDDIKICDFSCARILNKNSDKIQLLTGAVGTLKYMAPQILGKYDNSVDVWSYGCALFAMATGRSPFKIQKNQITECKKNQISEYIRKMSQPKINQFTNNLAKILLQTSNKLSTKQKQPQKISMKCTCSNNNHNDCYRKLSDLLRKIFVFNVNKRIKISQVISHSFFTGQQMQIQQQCKKLDTIQDYQANTKRQGYSSHTGITYNRTMRQHTRQTEQNVPKMDKDTMQKVIRPKTSYSLQNIKRMQNSIIRQQKQPQKKLIKTQNVITQPKQKQKQKYNLGNKTNIAAFMNKLSQQNDKQRQNNQNVNILNIDHYRKQKKQKQQQKQKQKQKQRQRQRQRQKNKRYSRQQNQQKNNVQQLFKHKLTDKYRTSNNLNLNMNMNMNQNRSSLQYKYISDGKQIKTSHNQSQNSSNPNSIRHIPQALNTQGINYVLRYPEKQEIITINSEGLKGQFLRSNKIMLISPKGRHITLSFQGRNKKYQLQRLPQKYTALYESYRQIVSGIRSKAKSVAKTSRQKQIRQQNKRHSPQPTSSIHNSQQKNNRQTQKSLPQEVKAQISLKIQLLHCHSPNPTKYQYKPTLAPTKKQYVLSLTKQQNKIKSQKQAISINLVESNSLNSYIKDDNKNSLLININPSGDQFAIEDLRRILLQLIEKVMVAEVKDRSEKEKVLGQIMQINYEYIQSYTQVLYKYYKWLTMMPTISISKKSIPVQNQQNMTKPTQNIKQINSNSNKSSLTNLNLCVTQNSNTGTVNNKQMMGNKVSRREKQSNKYDHRILLDNYSNPNRYR